MKTQEKVASAPTPLLPLPADKALESFYLEARCKLLDIAAILDRIQRGVAASTLAEDHRLLKIRQALQILLEAGPASTERIQQVFSLPYDASWERPKPK